MAIWVEQLHSIDPHSSTASHRIFLKIEKLVSLLFVAFLLHGLARAALACYKNSEVKRVVPHRSCQLVQGSLWEPVASQNCWHQLWIAHYYEILERNAKPAHIGSHQHFWMKLSYLAHTDYVVSRPVPSFRRSGRKI